MKTTKMLLPAALAAALVAVPAQAHDKRGDDDHGKSKSERKAERLAKWQAKHCEPRVKRYEVKATLVSATLTKNADGSYDGTVSGAVQRANKHARPHKGTTQTWTLDDARVKLRGPDRTGEGTLDQADLLPGDRVQVSGRITTLHRKCDQGGFTPTVTVKKVKFKAPKPAAPAKPTPRADDDDDKGAHDGHRHAKGDDGRKGKGRDDD